MKSTSITRSFLVVFVSLLTLTVSSTRVGAQTAPTTSYAFTVNTTVDTHDAHRGDGVCADKKGQCSLRAATEEADALPAGSSITITVPAGTYALRLGALLLTDQRTITINGAGSTTTIIKGNNTFRVLYIASPKMFASLSQLTIEGGNSNTGFGGGINNGGTLSVSNSTLSGNSATSGSGGGIFNHGTLSVSNSTISNNSAGGRGYGGGGIYNTGALSVTSSTFSNNSAPNGRGGGIYNHGKVSVSSSTISGNSANNSGGIYNDTVGTLSVSNSTVSGNQANNDGGGIDNDVGGTLTVTSSTISSNLANRGGGYGGGINNYGTLIVSSSTISGNSADVGGGINNYRKMTVSNSTISGNSAPYGGGIDESQYGTATLTGTIVANNTYPNCYNKVTEGVGYNLDSGTTCGFTLGSDLNNTDPKLGPLGNNGGPTWTMALLQGSKAIDWVAASSCPATDQRGYMRPDNGESMCDIGAYESAY